MFPAVHLVPSDSNLPITMSKQVDSSELFVSCTTHPVDSRTCVILQSSTQLRLILDPSSLGFFLIFADILVVFC